MVNVFATTNEYGEMRWDSRLVDINMVDLKVGLGSHGGNTTFTWPTNRLWPTVKFTIESFPNTRPVFRRIKQGLMELCKETNSVNERTIVSLYTDDLECADKIINYRKNLEKREQLKKQIKEQEDLYKVSCSSGNANNLSFESLKAKAVADQIELLKNELKELNQILSFGYCHHISYMGVRISDLPVMVISDRCTYRFLRLTDALYQNDYQGSFRFAGALMKEINRR